MADPTVNAVNAAAGMIVAVRAGAMIRELVGNVTGTPAMTVVTVAPVPRAPAVARVAADPNAVTAAAVAARAAALMIAVIRNVRVLSVTASVAPRRSAPVSVRND